MLKLQRMLRSNVVIFAVFWIVGISLLSFRDVREESPSDVADAMEGFTNGKYSFQHFR